MHTISGTVAAQFQCLSKAILANSKAAKSNESTARPEEYEIERESDDKSGQINCGALLHFGPIRRPLPVPLEILRLIREMSIANPLW